ncbi:MAG: hypothetical protein R2695_09025 [Acidimicrobiales bacterium]
MKARLRGTEMSSVDHGNGTIWPAVVMVFSFAWYELAYHSAAAPRSIGVYLLLYSVIVLGGAAVFGRGWVRRADGFGVLFTTLSAIAPFFVDEERRLRVRWPLAGVSTLPQTTAFVSFVIVVLGSTTFDGFTRSSFWFDLAGDEVGWGRTTFNTFGMVAVTLLVGLAYVLAINVMASMVDEPAEALTVAFGPSLVPIAAAYAVAHYFSFLVLEGQRMFIHISDPFGRGWDLFGTVDYEINWQFVSSQTIAWVQTLGIALGHVFGVAVAHDRAVSRYPHQLAVRSQYPMLVVMVLYTLAGLFLLLGK